ncbi:MAG: DNA adenine methylase [Caldilineaceae bacterium SB0661_bin_32]|uniref:Site-specific DNA-methyltransferase (adenine-specific) n=1 Tax=Caldilineaceae bacterium SB0661_bin_32 TaxID=2605255 RepID=A0A6B1D3Y4_9CHLR|nr:DNA adenine methylase [Caldilineaceae bacterium SB0661_bin_32]
MHPKQLQFPIAPEHGRRAKPFLKWAGGKGQLLGQIGQRLPAGLWEGSLTKYAEPFIGGGAVFFQIANHFNVREFYISDMNEDLVLAYRTIKQQVELLVERLEEIRRNYLVLDMAGRKQFYYATREQFNCGRSLGQRAADEDETAHVARLIFLNRTCFNGLYRVNSRGEFNVPHGNYRNPGICDAANLRSVSHSLQNTEVRFGDFTSCRNFVDENTFVYMDPPYRPISKTANFNSFYKSPFDDNEQRRLAHFYQELGNAGAKLMLSNSDPHNENPQDSFFQDLYAGFSIHKVSASRRINSNGAKRGPITELLIANY